MSKNYNIILIITIVFGVGLRLWNACSDPALWLDEVFSAQMAQSPLADLILAVPRFDTHPPLYYMQLHVWSLLGTGDRWLILNSVLLDTLVILSLFLAAGRIHGRAVGLWAAAIYAVMPLNVFFAENLRMYAQFFLLLVWLWYMLERRVRDPEGVSGKARIGTVLLGLAATLTHGLGFFVVFFVYFQALIRCWLLHRGRLGLRPAALIVLDYVPVALASGYSLGIGMFRRTEGMSDLNFDSMGVHLAISLLGMEAPFPATAGYLAFLLLLVPPLLGARARGVQLWLVFLPFAALLFLTLTVKSVFMYRTLGLFTPFAALAMGIFYADAWAERRGWQQALSGGVLLVLALAALNSSLGFRKEGYREIAAIWNREAPADATLFVDDSVNLWGVSRYLADVPRYSALDIQPPVRDGMLWLKGKLEGSYFDRAGLFGKSDHLMIGQRAIWPYVSDANMDGLGSYWVLDPLDGACLRPGDQRLRTFETPGKVLIECGMAPQPGS